MFLFEDLLDYSEPDVEEVFCLNFTITESYFGELVAKPLKPGKFSIFGLKLKKIPIFKHSKVH